MADFIITIPHAAALLIIDGIMANFPEASQTLRVTDWDYTGRKFTVIDTEEDDESTESGSKEYKITVENLIVGFAMMFVPGKWPKGLTHPPASGVYGGEKDFESPWAQWLGDSDASSFDAFLQLAVLGEVRYG